MFRTVLDTNTLVAAIINQKGNPAQNHHKGTSLEETQSLRRHSHCEPEQVL